MENIVWQDTTVSLDSEGNVPKYLVWRDTNFSFIEVEKYVNYILPDGANVVLQYMATSSKWSQLCDPNPPLFEQ